MIILKNCLSLLFLPWPRLKAVSLLAMPQRRESWITLLAGLARPNATLNLRDMFKLRILL